MSGRRAPRRAAGLAAEIVLGGVVLAALAGLVMALAALPSAPPAVDGWVAERLPETGLGNAVNAVLLDFRGFDTLIEKGILIVALLGLWAAIPDRAWGGAPANFRTGHAVEPVLSALVKVLLPVAALAAIYVLFVGAEHPGGAFQSGTLLAAMGILLVLGRVLPPPRQSSMPVRWAIAAGFLLFIAAGAATRAAGGAFLDYPRGWHKEVILVIEVGLTASVAAALLMLASGLPDAADAADAAEAADGAGDGDGR